jgi:hypothetical protein
MEVFSYGSKKNNDLLVITNQSVIYKDLDLRTSDPIMAIQYVKYEDFVIYSFHGNEQKPF